MTAATSNQMPRLASAWASATAMKLLIKIGCGTSGYLRQLMVYIYVYISPMQTLRVSWGFYLKRTS